MYRDARRIGALLIVLLAVVVPRTFARDITGTVRRPDGTPARDARIRLYYLHDASGYGSDWIGRETRARANGSFSLQRPPLERTPPVFLSRPLRAVYCVATAKGFASAIAECPPGPWPVQLTLGEARTVAVRVVDAGDVSVAGAKVSVHRVTAGFDEVTSNVLGPLHRALFHAIADRNGSATLTDVPRANLGISARHVKVGMGFGSVRARRTEARVALNGPAATRGRIVPPEGAAIPECVVIDAKGLAAGSASWAAVGRDGAFALLSESAGLTPWASMQKRGNALVIAALETTREPRLGTLTASLAESERGEVAHIPFPPGRRVEGLVTNEADGEPLPGTLILATLGEPRAPLFRFMRAADGHGRFAFRLPPDVPATLRVTGVPRGFVMVTPVDADRLTRPIAATGDALNTHLAVRALPAAYLCVRVQLGKDVHAPGASVMVQQSGLRAVLAVSDATGRAVVGPLIKGVAAAVLANGKDADRAAQEIIPADAVREINEFTVTLGQGVSGKVLVTDEAGEAIPAHVTVSLATRDAAVAVSRAVAATPQEMKGGLTLPGLIRGKTYRVKVQSRKRADRELDWTLAAKGKIEPFKVALAGNEGEAPAPHPPAVAKTNEAREAFDRKRAALKDTTWERPDPHVKGQTWYGLPHGIAVFDENTLKAHRFTEFFGQGKLTPTAIAFDKTSVYVGTEKGLAVYSRRMLGWTRLVVGGIFIDRPVRTLAMNDGTLRVTVVAPSGAALTYDLDTADGGWMKVK